MAVVVEDTKVRLLDAAGAEFAAKGFRGATIRSIIQRAEANLAAVHYHFGDKEGLYVAAVLEAHRRCSRPMPDEDHEETDPREQLRSHIRQFLSNVLAVDRPDDWPNILMLREFAQPTRASDVLVRELIRPKFERLSAIIAMLRPDLAGRELQAMVFSVVGQCMHYRFCRPISERLVGKSAFERFDLDFLTDHITSFTLGALMGTSAGGGP